MTTRVAQKIKDSLLNSSNSDFYLLNRGILLSAKDVDYSNGELAVSFNDFDVHGNVDGGHTYKTILENRDKLDCNQQFVKIEILTGIEPFYQDLAAARNTSVQVQDQSIAELENRFDIIKEALASESYIDRIFYKENDTSGDIDVADVMAILNMFNIDQYPDRSIMPVCSYSGKKKCIDTYIKYHKECRDNMSANPYVKMRKIMPDIFKLYDAIEVSMGDFYRKKNPKGRYGAIKGVKLPKTGEEMLSRFMLTKMDADSPTSLTYPILGAFRALVIEKDGEYQWRKNPFDALKKVGPELVYTIIEKYRELGNNPQTVGKSVNTWSSLYMILQLETLEALS